jgi:hypothetical protein
MRLSLFKIILTAAVIFGLAFASAPYFAFRALRAATAAEDVQATADLVDFPAVRKSLTSQLAPDQVSGGAEPPSIWQDPIGALKRAIEPLAPAEPKVDRYLTLKGLSALTRGYKPGSAPPPAPVSQGVADQLKDAVKGPWPSVAYWGVDRTRIAVKRPEHPDKVTVFTFERRALFTWKLAHVQLPEGER